MMQRCPDERWVIQSGTAWHHVTTGRACRVMGQRQCPAGYRITQKADGSWQHAQHGNPCTHVEKVCRKCAVGPLFPCEDHVQTKEKK